MFTHPDLMWAQLKQHQSDLIAEADAYRLLAVARRSRRATAGQVSKEPGAAGPTAAPWLRRIPPAPVLAADPTRRRQPVDRRAGHECIVASSRQPSTPLP